jgi:hypothetical protein
MQDLADELKPFGIEVTVCPTEREFNHAFQDSTGSGTLSSRTW